LLSRSAAELPRVEPSIAALVQIAQDLRDLPRPSFKARLKSNLERTSSMANQATAVAPTQQTATARLRIRNAAAAIEFYKKAFGAREIMRFEVRGQIPHAEIAIGNSVISLGEEALEYGYPGPQTLGGSPVSIHLWVEDVDAFVEHAVAAGAKLAGAVTDQFYGDRSGSVTDPFGYTWGIATRKQEMSVEEMHQRFNEMMNTQAANRTASSFIPKGYHTVTPYLVVQDAPALIDFARQVYGAEETFRAIGSAAASTPKSVSAIPC
jgi:PhnB protein